MNMFSSSHLRSTFDFLVKSPSFISLPLKIACGDVFRAMSSDRRRSIQDKVEARLRQETVKSRKDIRRAMEIQRQVMSVEEKLIFLLKRARRKVGALLLQLSKYELPELPPNMHDPELLTPEQLQALKKIGLKNKNYYILGQRGVYGGTILNMHLHWKFHETVQIFCDRFPVDYVKETAALLAKLSGGIVVAIHEQKTIIMYRGRNYRVPDILTPFNTLTRRKAFFQGRFEQTVNHLKNKIMTLEERLRHFGINPDDPVAMSKSRRIPSLFFTGIDLGERRHFSFHDHERSSEAEVPFVDSDQEEVDRFVSEIEYNADQDFVAEESTERESVGKIRYQNREGFRFGGSEMLRNGNLNTGYFETSGMPRNEDIGNGRPSEDNKKEDEHGVHQENRSGLSCNGGFGGDVGNRRFREHKQGNQRKVGEDRGYWKEDSPWKEQMVVDTMEKGFEYGRFYHPNEEMKHEKDSQSRQRRRVMNDNREDETRLERSEISEKSVEDGYARNRVYGICNERDAVDEEENDVKVVSWRRRQPQSHGNERGGDYKFNGELERKGYGSGNVGSEGKFDPRGSASLDDHDDESGRDYSDEVSGELPTWESDSEAYRAACIDYGREEEEDEENVVINRNEEFGKGKEPKTAKEMDEQWDSD